MTVFADDLPVVVHARNKAKIEELLLLENGSAKKYTFTTYDQIQKVCQRARTVLNRLGFYQSDVDEIRVMCYSDEAKARHRETYRTKIWLHRAKKKGNWKLTDITRVKTAYVPAYNPQVYIDGVHLRDRLMKVAGSYGIFEIEDPPDWGEDENWDLDTDLNDTRFVEGSQHFGVPLWAEAAHEDAWNKIVGWTILLPTGNALDLDTCLNELNLGTKSRLELFQKLKKKQREGLRSAIKWFLAVRRS